MGLPEDWVGVFYDSTTRGDMLFDLEPEALIEEFAQYPEQGPFLIAGAITDLFINDADSVRAMQLIDRAGMRWEDFPWMLSAYFATMVRTAEARGQEVENARKGIEAIVRKLFGNVSFADALREQREVQADL